MRDVQYYKNIFDKYGGIMRTTQLAEEKIFYPQREKLVEEGLVEKRKENKKWIIMQSLLLSNTTLQQ